MINEFRFDECIDETARQVSLMDGQLDFAEHLVRNDYLSEDDRRQVEEIVEWQFQVRLGYLRDRLNTLAFRVSKLREKMGGNKP